jgi:hypothetical protein
VPQLSGSVWNVVSVVQPAPAPHELVPVGHAHAPEVQIAPEPHVLVHEPQCCGLLETSKQPFAHAVAGA